MHSPSRSRFVYDAPTRLFHWLFTGLFVTGFTVAQIVDDESSVFPIHMLIGLTLGFVVCLRLIWGLVGTQYARFSGFALRPKDLIAYFQGILVGDRKRWPGHNPASSWAAIAMWSLTIGLVTTGILMTNSAATLGTSTELLEEVHEVLANAFIIVILGHLAGLILHTIRFRDAIGLSMLDGKKAVEVQTQKPVPAHRGVAIVVFGLVLSFATKLALSYDSKSRSLSAFGQVLQLGGTETDGERGSRTEDRPQGSGDDDRDSDAEDD